MAVNLEAQYGLVIGTLFLYSEFAARLFRRIRYRVWLLGSGKTQDVLALRFFMRRMMFFCPHTDEEMKKLINRFAKNEERTDPFFDVILSDYPYETLALQLEGECPDVDFAQIAKLFELRDKPLPWISFKVLITSIIGVGLFFLNTFPDSIVEQLGGSVDSYELFVLSLTYDLAMSVAIFWGFYWLFFGRRLSVLRLGVRDAIGYLAIRSTRSDAQPSATVDR